MVLFPIPSLPDPVAVHPSRRRPPAPPSKPKPSQAWRKGGASSSSSSSWAGLIRWREPDLVGEEMEKGGWAYLDYTDLGFTEEEKNQNFAMFKDLGLLRSIENS
ncbi:hypothetical protein L484_020659 [Morus notabilis]|uniref:Uncharacterized protein n=1 Tax=Morus notabilis TaxID=981085 RepID=W9S963_9ROSA|nr:hypothetical protein L484_020659 [Morus notabilis]